MNCKDARDVMLEVLTTNSPPDARRVLFAHLDDCPACRAEAAEFAETIALLRTLPDPAPPPGFWPEFMTAVEGRAAGEGPLWARAVRWLRTPRVSWTAAVAGAVIAVIIALTFWSPVPQSTPVSSPVTGLVTESVRQTVPSVQGTLTLWNNGLTGVEVPYDFRPGGR